MKRPLALIAGTALLALGVWSAVALAAGNDQQETSTVATTITGVTTGETEDTTTGETTDRTATAASKVWLCHHTGSWKHPYHLIHISTHGLHAHLRNVDVLPGANNSCPTTQPAHAKTHGHEKRHGARPNGHGSDGQNEAAETKDD